MSASITGLCTADLPEVLAFWATIEGVGLNESDTEACLASYLERNAGLSLLARCDERIVGAVLCGHDGRRGYLHHLAVADEYRRRGIGSVLVERCLAKLAELGIQKCNIFVYADNDDGTVFWSRSGWSERGDLKLMQRQILSGR
jgi:ribosomal protein S18 acetylase RimI-like enzyme